MAQRSVLERGWYLTPGLKAPICSDVRMLLLDSTEPGAAVRIQRIVGPGHVGGPSRLFGLLPRSPFQVPLPNDWALQDPSDDEVAFIISQESNSTANNIASSSSEPQAVVRMAPRPSKRELTLLIPAPSSTPAPGSSPCWGPPRVPR